jgi:hypothetical protein
VARAVVPLVNRPDVIGQLNLILLLQPGNVSGGKSGLQTGQHLRRVGFENGFEPGENFRHRFADHGGHGRCDGIEKTPHQAPMLVQHFLHLDDVMGIAHKHQRVPSDPKVA